MDKAVKLVPLILIWQIVIYLLSAIPCLNNQGWGSKILHNPMYEYYNKVYVTVLTKMATTGQGKERTPFHPESLVQRTLVFHKQETSGCSPLLPNQSLLALKIFYYLNNLQPTAQDKK